MTDVNVDTEMFGDMTVKIVAFSADQYQLFLRSESMNFPHAAKGIKKLFIAEILCLVSVVSIGLGTILALFSAPNEGSGALVLTSISIGSFLVFLALILQIIGVIQAAKDEESFRIVIHVTLFSIAVSLITSALSVIFRDDAILPSVANLVSSVVAVITTVLIIIGICNLMNTLGKQDLVAKGGKILRIVVWLAVLSLIMSFINIFLPNNIEDAKPLAKVIVICLTVLAVVLEIIEYVLYISLLGKASKALN